MRNIFKAAFVVGSALVSSFAMAEGQSVSASIIPEITSVKADAVAIGTAVLGVIVAIYAFKLIRRAIS